MKTSLLSSMALLAVAASAAPTVPEPEGGWENVKYPAGTGENLPNYPAPPGGWENVNYPPGTGATPAPPAGCPAPGPLPFTSTFSVVATPEQVYDEDEGFTGGLPGAIGYYDFGINSAMNTICYSIRLINFQGEYESPADTATHIHEAAAGAAGPPRLAFPNPQGEGAERVSMGCLTGPFETGVTDEESGEDTGAGFTVDQIEANPAAFFADVHSSLAVPGAVRGQLA